MDVSAHSVNEQWIRRSETRGDRPRMLCCTALWIELDQMIAAVLAREPSYAKLASALGMSTRLLHLSGAISPIIASHADYTRATQELEDCCRMLR